MNIINFEEAKPTIETEYYPTGVSLYEHLTCAGDLRKETISNILGHYENIATAIDRAEKDGIFSEDDDFTANLK